MKRWIVALGGSIVAHFILAMGVTIYFQSRGGWLREQLRLGSAYPTATVQLHWSGVSGLDHPLARSSTQGMNRKAFNLYQKEVPKSGMQGKSSLPNGNLLSTRGSPEYPPLSRRSGEEGTVTLEFSLTPEGKADGVQIVKSSGYRRLDESALAFLKSTHVLTPKGAVSQKKLNLSFVFKLED